MSSNERVRTITVLGRKWHDKVNGNTYNTAQILVNGVTVGKTQFQYGYDDFYVQAAAEWLEKNGHISHQPHNNGGSQPLWQYCRDNNIHLETQSAYYKKREL